MPADRVLSTVELLSRSNPFSGAVDLPDPPRPDEKMIPRNLPSAEQLPYIQKQLDILTYNHLSHTFFNLEKTRSLQSILITGKETLTEALPIRCLEATFTGLYLTQDLKDVDRIPLSFRSRVKGAHYQHIVLALHVQQPTSLYGALGLSRKHTLMYKPLIYRTLYHLVMDYKGEYERLGHELLDIKLGLAVTHEQHWHHPPCWRFVALRLSQYLSESAANKLPSPDSSARTQNDGPLDVSEVLQNEPICTEEIIRTPLSSPSGAAPINPLAQFLAKFCRLLPVMSEQYCRTLPMVDHTNRNAKLCFLSLEEAERDAKDENERRIAAIVKMQSPLSSDARMAAANRQRGSSVKKRRFRSRGKGSKKKDKKRVEAKGASPVTLSNTSARRLPALDSPRSVPPPDATRLTETQTAEPSPSPVVFRELDTKSISKVASHSPDQRRMDFPKSAPMMAPRNADSPCSPPDRVSWSDSETSSSDIYSDQGEGEL